MTLFTPERISLELSDGLEIAFSPHKLRQPSGGVAVRTAIVRAEPLEFRGVFLPALAALRTDESNERVYHNPPYTLRG